MEDITPTPEAFNRALWDTLWRIALAEYREGHRARLVELLRNETNPPRSVLAALADLVESAPLKRKRTKLTPGQRLVLRTLKRGLAAGEREPVEGTCSLCASLSKAVSAPYPDIHAALFSEATPQALRGLRTKVLIHLKLPDVPPGTICDCTKARSRTRTKARSRTLR